MDSGSNKLSWVEYPPAKRWSLGIINPWGDEPWHN